MRIVSNRMPVFADLLGLMTTSIDFRRKTGSCTSVTSWRCESVRKTGAHSYGRGHGSDRSCVASTPTTCISACGAIGSTRLAVNSLGLFDTTVHSR